MAYVRFQNFNGICHFHGTFEVKRKTEKTFVKCLVTFFPETCNIYGGNLLVFGDKKYFRHTILI